MSEALPDYTPPTSTVTEDGIPNLENHGPSARLNVYDELPTRDLTLLFLQGRSATPFAGGASAWADQEGGRVVVFDHDGRVERVLAGSPPGGQPLTRPAFVAVENDRVLGVEIDGQALRFAGSEPERWFPDYMPGAAVGDSERGIVSTRTVFDLEIAPLPPTAPLLWRRVDGEVRPVGRIQMPRQAMLAPLVNSGWVAGTPDGGVVFAAAVRPELRKYNAAGDLVWISTWPHEGAMEPIFGISNGTLVPRFRLTQQALNVGEDGAIYVLATSGDTGPADRLLTFDQDGKLAAEAAIDGTSAIYLGRGGHIYATPPATALARTETETTRVAFAPFVLPELDGDGEIRLEDHIGKVVIVNFWASWCVPCRNEMPQLDALAQELSPQDAIVLGLNEDVRPANAIAFVEELGGVSYPLAEGLGRLREEYGYRGLPYTVVLDRQGEVVKLFYGFGESIEPIRQAVLGAIGTQ